MSIDRGSDLPPPEVAEQPPAHPAQTPPTRGPKPKRTRTGAAWVGVAVAVVLLVALIDFIAQNTGRVRVAFLGWHGRFPLSVALLVAAVGAAIIVTAVGTARIVQLRLAARRIRKNT